MKRPQRRSLRALDGLGFLMADVRDGLGPYLSVFLRGTQHWQADRIGIAMAASNLSAAACQIPAGLVADRVRVKRLVVAIAALAVAVGALCIVRWPGFGAVLGAQIVLGGASALIPPLLAALSLGIVGQEALDDRISRNEAFNHGGNFVAAGLAGVTGQYVGMQWLFYLVCAFAMGSAAVVRFIDPADIDHEAARGGREGERPMPVRELLRRRELLLFLGSVVLFHLGNAAMLPLAGQMLAEKHPGTDTIALSACIIAAQLVMIGVAWLVGALRRRGVGLKKLYLAALLVLPVRGVLFTLSSSPFAVVAIQLLDGVAAGTFGVVAVLFAAELTRGTGRFNLAQGLTALCVGVGAALSNALGGVVVRHGGFRTGFLFLAAIAAGAFVFALIFVPSADTVRAA